MKVKTSELTGPVLNWAVATINGDGVKYGAKAYSTDWELAGPIIEREKVDTAFTEDGWYANMYNRMTDSTEGYSGDTYRCGGEGPTPLIAAMRCYVASKLGDEVEIPEELQ